MEQPRAGKHYPRSVGEFQAWFRTDADCLDYLDWLRWPEGFACPGCGHGERWSLSDRRIMCASCGGRTSVTAGTIFERTRTPLTVWFTAGWLFATGKDGISALSLQRTLEVGSYQTAWAMLHRLRSVLVRPGRDRLAGAVEVDETYIGGEEPGLRGGRARGKKVLTGIAVEVQDPKGLGRCRMGPLPDASASSLHGFVTDHVEPGARVITDGWQGYHGVEQLGYLHDRHSQRAARTRGADPHEAAPGGPPGRLPGQALAPGHPPRLSGRRALTRIPERVCVSLQPPPLPQPRARVLSGAAAGRDPCAGPLPGPGRPHAPSGPPAYAAAYPRTPPPSLERPPANRPWRAVDLGYSG